MALTDEDARKIRESYKEGYDVTALAQDYDVPPRNIRRILRFETFADAGGPVTYVDSTSVHPYVRAAIIGEYGKGRWRGQDVYIMDKYDISYNTLRAIKDYMADRA